MKLLITPRVAEERRVTEEEEEEDVEERVRLPREASSTLGVGGEGQGPASGVSGDRGRDRAGEAWREMGRCGSEAETMSRFLCRRTP